LVSLPAYDNNLFAKGISSKDYALLLNDKDHPMVNRAVSGTYPSGSVIKPVVSAAALQEGVITPNTTVDTSSGAIKIGQWVFPDWKIHGVVDVKKAIAESNDIFFYAVGGGWQNIKGLGIKKLDEWLKKFNFGNPTGIDLPNEASGLVPDDAWKRKVKKEAWYIGDTYHLSIGQGYFLSTPLQVANATATIANGGQVIKPHLLDKVVDNNGNIKQIYKKEVVRENFIDPRHLQTVREGMRQMVTAGNLFQNFPVAVAGKTGTAQYGLNNENDHAWFTCFAPYDNPEIVVTAIVEGGGHGYYAAVPVAQKILAAIKTIRIKNIHTTQILVS
jgi:penicillin-binding protein 2